jgi:hypothetical protein
MDLRALLAALIVTATAAFVVGTTLERNNQHTESAATLKGEGAAATGESASHRRAEGLPPETTRESPATHAAEGGAKHTHAELKPLGVDIEAVPFVVVAALASLGLAAAAWARPRWLPLLLVVAATMLAFAALDVREIFHQNDEGQTGLAVLAAAVAALHVAAGTVAGLMARQAARARAA